MLGVPALVLAVVVWVASASPPAPSSAGATGESVIQQYPPEERLDVDDFDGELLTGKSFALSDVAGQVAVFNVWGSWCVPCRREAPALVKVADEFAGRVSFVGINVRDSVSAARAFERRFGVPYDSLRAEDADEALLAFGNSMAAAIPTTAVVDPDGRIAARVVGPTSYLTLRTLVTEVLEEGSRRQVRQQGGSR